MRSQSLSPPAHPPPPPSVTGQLSTDDWDGDGSYISVVERADPLLNTVDTVCSLYEVRGLSGLFLQLSPRTLVAMIYVGIPEHFHRLVCFGCTATLEYSYRHNDVGALKESRKSSNPFFFV